MCLEGMGKILVNSKYPLSWLRFELLSLKHKTDATVFLRIFLVGYFIVLKERD